MRGRDMGKKRLSTAERREQIAEAALKIIAERGLREFTVAAISEEVGLADGTIFRHFDDKDDIVLEAVRRLEIALISQGMPDADDPLERLGAFVRARVELISSRPEIPRLLFSDDLAKAGPRMAAERIRALKQRSMQFILAQLREASARGLLREDVEPEQLLYVIHGTALAHVFSGQELHDVSSDTPSADAVWTTVEKLIRRSQD